MNIAVCLECGGMKHDALAPCASCGHQPQEAEDAARHLLASDDFLTRAQVEQAADLVRRGRTLRFDPEAVREQTAWVRRTFGGGRRGRRRPRLLEALVLVVVTGVLATVAGYLLYRH